MKRVQKIGSLRDLKIPIKIEVWIKLQELNEQTDLQSQKDTTTETCSTTSRKHLSATIDDLIRI